MALFIVIICDDLKDKNDYRTETAEMTRPINIAYKRDLET